MRKDKPTFVDHKTGIEMESTPLARWVSWVLLVLFCGLILGPISRLIDGLGGRFFEALGSVLLCAVGCTLVVPQKEGARRFRFTRWAHDGISRRQHYRRLIESEWAHVPDTALSRAPSPGEPQPTDAALSVADEPVEARLTVEAPENTTETVMDGNA